MINKMTSKINKNDLRWLKTIKNVIKRHHFLCFFHGMATVRYKNESWHILLYLKAQESTFSIYYIWKHQMGLDSLFHSDFLLFSGSSKPVTCCIIRFATLYKIFIYFSFYQTLLGAICTIFNAWRWLGNRMLLLHNEELHSLYRTPNIVRVIKSRRLR